MKFAILLGAVLAFEGQALALFDCVKGNGDVIQETRSYKNIDKIKMMAAVDLTVAKSDKTRVEIEGPKDLIQNLNIEGKGGEFSVADDRCSRNTKKIKLKLFVSELSEIAVLGSSDIKVVDSFDADNLKIEIAGAGDVSGTFKTDYLGVDIKGSGDVKLKGSTDEFNIDIMGSGDVTSLDLAAKKVEVSIKGSGDVKVNALDTLKVQILGSGDVRYSGRPKVDLQKFGSGYIKAL